MSNNLLLSNFYYLMLTLRLQRTGTKNRPTFRIVLAESYRAAGKKAIEVLGHYNPRNKEMGIKDQERLQYWIKQHVALSPTVHNLLVEKKFLDAKKVKAWRPKVTEKAPENAAPATLPTQAEPGVGIEAKE
ncbi:MAG: 30S ribosomal protein S16 [Candidatus Doudnabacteria bacterium RIFCSPHIGHO2_02_FULL_42_25]|uniref:30S ribosomal protein S16 n=1 Tax=Candidatus Doudnabacteria bacterium RIFCSPHIGHO2_01_FULL_41_86 TaxID=1817821 RepID=A0A1F5N8U3_9BACT|nr:MAG: 30S ribosomal protein S16 [Candidatus Doudnabacteria bacterium RIFCSPHIGHO2_01_FULL_41_86]OGE86444.1 MAG: 30S ribosomal protein S16 [Candidatus Doudnabacteria bacterium RIFCSPHIGHO2_12_FULL_42_22]OGE87443.1 MAG: 30S ribosomal protein S16 [Candidatus Doudnabacteria bacterium RIFCSPHIGHO2_02_FULL_42_25]OGE92741.1 MAG: 30S ribosomal protein S16 [Candidatus Doudnabacteria bacterium RIFCSPLOWO2_01_FULL_42_60]OGE99243.1 MAG: 30S ribosomal protein S16 [Candidatus Doudnabacteria bacterium RIFCS